MEKIIQKKFYGTTNLGEKGQVVIPIDARKTMKLEKSDRLFVFGIGNEVILLAKPKTIEKFASKLVSKLLAMQKIVKKTKP